MAGLWDDIKVPPMDPRERADLELEAGRAFLSEIHAIEYRRRQANSWKDKEAKA